MAKPAYLRLARLTADPHNGITQQTPRHQVFVDKVTIHVRGGAGGAGVAAFKRAKGKPRGRPEGGTGGSGGDIYLEADAGTATLLAFKRNPHHVAGSGTHGESDFRHGRDGDDIVLSVPVGTLVRDDAGTVIADLVEPKQRVMAAEGGRGGRGNASFVGPSHKAPTYAEQGEYGVRASLVLELKLIADAALVGFPNAGKSTLISRVSAAKPKIADYPFTTLQPHLGVVEIASREFVLADIPGLIEGAADGKGLGHEFLRHTERARVLVILLDPSPLQVEPLDRQYQVLTAELAAHSETLAARPRVVAINKADLVGDAEPPSLLDSGDLDEVGSVHLVSAVTGTGLDDLMHSVADAVETEERAAPDRQGFVLHRPGPPPFEIGKDGAGWVVHGKAAERAVALADLTVPEAADLAARRLARLGVDNALRDAGARPGDDVRIGELVFEFQPDDGDVAYADDGGDA